MKPEVLMSEDHGWKRNHIVTSGGQYIDVWFKGYFWGGKFLQDYLRLIKTWTEQGPPSITVLNRWVQGLSGHYAIVFDAGGWVFGACDRVRSIPLIYYQTDDVCVISNQLKLIKDKYSLDKFGNNEAAAIEIATSGYTIGRKSLYKNLHQITAGEWMLIKQTGVERRTHFSYMKPTKNSVDRNHLQLSEVLLHSFQDIRENVSNRQFIVPLSAGYDSRLIASGLKKVGVENVLCFSYGHKDSFEVKTGKRVASGLGYDWIHIDLDRKYSKKIFESDVFEEYKCFADIACGTPYIREFAAIYRLLSEHANKVESDAIFINGNTGDFISGGHIAEPLLTDKALDPFEVAADYAMYKHYMLWDMTSNALRKKIKRRLKICAKQLALGSEVGVTPPEPYVLYELMEWYGRQSKLIVSMQRIYEYFGYEWRMPLWNNRLMDFWLDAPISQKLNKKLYTDTLMQNNWGGVWHTTGINKLTVRPAWMSIVRFILKILFLLFRSTDKWHRFERMKLYYWMDPYHYNYPLPYRDIFLDKMGHRSHLSWWVEIYLKKYGFSLKDIIQVK